MSRKFSNRHQIEQDRTNPLALGLGRTATGRGRIALVGDVGAGAVTVPWRVGAGAVAVPRRLGRSARSGPARWAIAVGTVTPSRRVVLGRSGWGGRRSAVPAAVALVLPVVRPSVPAPVALVLPVVRPSVPAAVAAVTALVLPAVTLVLPRAGVRPVGGAVDVAAAGAGAGPVHGRPPWAQCTAEPAGAPS